jgi:hypothetical protein
MARPLEGVRAISALLKDLPALERLSVYEVIMNMTVLSQAWPVASIAATVIPCNTPDP